ncbi:hypothetical protein BY996DRAFT_6413459 [Phakopsora pachyrhizi]|uniref:Expressed protein n=1 Tax=Phakopsora pachyrhizi TaxID=170000 RepID=A0AAV0B679_PHAPC|nr:hypothetical protein BY996DRAFT_6413459 [Phakopsora pachyrhizi]CAH7678423.1 expressed protein [Phakopsora pachyrhizi]
MESQPLPDWLQVVTLRYQDSDQFTTGLIQLPIPYDGPKIPLGWPYTMAPQNTKTESSETYMTSMAPPPAVTQTLKFLDGGGPFTVVDGVIITSSSAPAPTYAPSILPSPATITSPPSLPKPSLIVMTSVFTVTSVIKDQNTSTAQTGATYNSIVTGFILLLLFSATLTAIILVFLIRRRRKQMREASERKLDFGYSIPEVKSRAYICDYPHRKDSSQNYCKHSEAMRKRTDLLAPEVKLQEGHNIDSMESKFIDPKDFEGPSEKSRWKKLVEHFQSLFRRTPHLAQECESKVIHLHPGDDVRRYYQNPYHDPSISTDTAVRVFRWRTRCESPSPSALFISNLTLSSKTTNQEPKSDGKGNLHANGTFCYGQSSVVSGPKKKSKRCFLSPSTSGKEAKSSPEQLWNYGASESARELRLPKKKATNTSNSKNCAFFRGNQTSSSRSSRRNNRIKQYSDFSPPLLLDERSDDDECSNDTDASDSPVDYETVPMRSSPIKKVLNSDLGGVESDFNLSTQESRICLHTRLGCSAKRIRKKRPSSISFKNGAEVDLGEDPSKNSPSTPFILSTKPLVIKKSSPSSSASKVGGLKSHMLMDEGTIIPSPYNSQNGSSVDANMSHDELNNSSGRNTEALSGVINSHNFRKSPSDLPNYPCASHQSASASRGDVGSLSSGAFNSIVNKDEDHQSVLSIGNVGGVTELGLLKNKVSQNTLDEDKSFASGELFYVKPRKSAVTREISWNFDQESSANTNPHELLNKSPSLDPIPEATKSGELISPVKSSSDSSQVKFDKTHSSHGSQERVTDESVVSPTQAKCGIIKRGTFVSNPYFPHHAAPDSLASDKVSSEARAERRISIAVSKSLNSMEGNRRCVSTPVNIGKNSSEYDMVSPRDLESYLNESQSPLGRIAARTRRLIQLPGNDRYSDSEGEKVPEDDEESGENDRLLVNGERNSSICSRATLGKLVKLFFYLITNRDCMN